MSNTQDFRVYGKEKKGKLLKLLNRRCPDCNHLLELRSVDEKEIIVCADDCGYSESFGRKRNEREE